MQNVAGSHIRLFVALLPILLIACGSSEKAPQPRAPKAKASSSYDLTKYGLAVQVIAPADAAIKRAMRFDKRPAVSITTSDFDLVMFTIPSTDRSRYQSQAFTKNNPGSAIASENRLPNGWMFVSKHATSYGFTVVRTDLAIACHNVRELASEAEARAAADVCSGARAAPR